MRGLSFGEFPIGVNALIFVIAAVVVFAAGSRLASYADDIARRTGASQAFLGALLLGVATSLPEIATTITSSWIGNPRLAASNLFGGVAMQVAILAIVDAITDRRALTRFTPQPILLFQGVMVILLLAVAIAGALVGEPLAVANVGLTPVLLVGGYLFTLWVSQRPALAPRWKTTDEHPTEHEKPVDESVYPGSNARLALMTGVMAVVILGAGWCLALVGDAIAKQTNLGSSFVGVTLVAISTSLPELSTTLGAARRGNHEMAVANILGTNCLEVALFFVADVFYREGAILRAVDRSSMFAATLGMIVTGVYLVGLLERRDRTIFRMGIDSAVVMVLYLCGVGVLYTLR